MMSVTNGRLKAVRHSLIITLENVCWCCDMPQQPLKQLAKFRQSLVSAVYVDQSVRDSRASSFIFSGLPISPSHSDRSIVTETFLNECHVEVDIINTKRLGKSQPSTSSSSPTAIQLLLVNVRTTEHAKLIISSSVATLDSSFHSQ